MSIRKAELSLDFLWVGQTKLLTMLTSIRDRPQTCFVFSIICRPYAVTPDEIGRQGSFPMVAPVKPYTEFALIYTTV